MTRTLALNLPAGYKPSDGEVNNLIYLTLKFTVGWPARAADLAVVKLLVPNPVGQEGVDKVVWETCQYAWDHLAGEPDDVTPEQFFDHMKYGLAQWYATTTPEQRAFG